MFKSFRSWKFPSTELPAVWKPYVEKLEAEIERLEAACKKHVEAWQCQVDKRYEAINRAEKAEAKAEQLERLVKMGEAVVEDFLPNIGRCVLQDYGRMNDFLMEANALNSTQEKGDEN